MYHDGLTDIDATILKLADMVPVLQVEALGKKKQEIVDEAHRLLDLCSVRHPEHIRNALHTGTQACTIPWKVIQQLVQNHFTDIGTQQFFTDTWMIRVKVKDVIRDYPAISLDIPDPLG